MNNNFNQSGQFGGWTPSPYGNGAGMFNEQYLKNVQKERDKQEIKKISNKCFFAVIWYVLISYGISFLIVFTSWVFPSISKIYNESLPSLAFDIILSIFTIVAPFLFAHLAIKKEKLSVVGLPFGTTFNKKASKYLVMMFLPVMIISAIAINYISLFIQGMLGIEFTSNISGITLYGVKETLLGVLSIAVVPAIIEETIIRGIVMQPLRKYGDVFAIIASAGLFACMHGNMVQIPYTIIGGLLLGFLVVATGSLWPCIVLHFINNLYSVIVVSVNDNFGETPSIIVTAIMILGFIIIGLIGTIKFVKLKYKVDLSEGETLLTSEEKFSAFLKNGPAIVAIILLVLVVLSNIKF